MKNRMLLKNLSGLVLGEFYFIEPSKFQRRFFVRIIRVCVCVCVRVCIHVVWCHVASNVAALKASSAYLDLATRMRDPLLLIPAWPSLWSYHLPSGISQRPPPHRSRETVGRAQEEHSQSAELANSAHL